jgi:ATP-dependent DNA helicase RecQ
VPRAKLRVVLTALVEAGIAAEPERGRLHLARRASHAEVEALAGRYREKAGADRERLKRMMAYAQTALCRWRALLAYFGEELEWERCGRCDNCRRPIEKPASMPHAEPPVVRPEDAQPLPPLLGGARPGALRPGDAVTLTIYGRGEVRSVGEDVVSIALGDGETRRFRLPETRAAE